MSSKNFMVNWAEHEMFFILPRGQGTFYISLYISKLTYSEVLE